MENDERITTSRNRVFDTSSRPAIGKNNPNAMATKSTSIYRITGMNQVKDILACGYVRPREGKLKGGHTNEVFWSKGSDKLFYFDKAATVLEVPEDKLMNDQIGAVPFEDLSGIWQYNDEVDKFENRLEFYQKVYKEVHNLNGVKTK